MKLSANYQYCKKTGNYIQKRFRGDIQWHPWQQSVLNIINSDLTLDKLNIVVDPIGMTGKTFLSLYCGTFGIAQRLFALDSKSLKSLFIKSPKSKVYVIYIKNNSLGADIKSIVDICEEVSNGSLCGSSGKIEAFDNPTIWVFIRENLTDIEVDKFNVFRINKEFALTQ